MDLHGRNKRCCRESTVYTEPTCEKSLCLCCPLHPILPITSRYRALRDSAEWNPDTKLEDDTNRTLPVSQQVEQLGRRTSIRPEPTPPLELKSCNRPDQNRVTAVTPPSHRHRLLTPQDRGTECCSKLLPLESLQDLACHSCLSGGTLLHGARSYHFAGEKG